MTFTIPPPKIENDPKADIELLKTYYHNEKKKFGLAVDHILKKHSESIDRLEQMESQAKQSVFFFLLFLFID